ncbi:MAG: hypothetical protein ACJAU2_000277 [Maribacter sp.]|jgi:hypothetical protein
MFTVNEGSMVGMYKIKKAEQCSAFFPNLTMNLTYLCYGSLKIWRTFRFIKGIGQTPKISGLKAVIVKRMGKTV